MSWKRFFRREQWDRERLAEIESYVAIETDDNLARGMTEGEARAAALRKFGHITGVREEIYEMNTVAFFDSLLRDIRHSLRGFRRTPTFTAVALLTLTIGIGANTAVYSVVNSVLLKPLPYPDADRLVAIWQKAPGAAGLASVSGDLRMSASMFFTYLDQNRTLESMGMWDTGTNSITGFAQPEEVPAVYVSEGALPALAVPPFLGRLLLRSDHVVGAPRTVLIGYGFWQQRFGGDRSVIGRKLMIDAQPTEIVGVMPRGFRFIDHPADLILPWAFDRSKLSLPGFGYMGVARLKPGVTIAQANADLARLVPVWMMSWPPPKGINPREYENWHIQPALRPLKEEVVGGSAGVLWVVMGTVVIVMVIVCANVANLLLVRAEGRQQELALRAALGAGRGRMIRELLVESNLLGLAGGALGVWLAYAGLRFLAVLGPGNLPRLTEISMDARALAFTLGLSLLSGVVFGAIPAWKYARHGISAAMRGGGRTASQSREHHRTRNILVVAQVALAMVLLVSSGLMIRTFQALHHVEPGFTHPEQIQTLRLTIPSTLVAEPERVLRMQNDIADRIAAIPGVTSTGFVSEMPMEPIEHDWDAVLPEGQSFTGGQIPPMRLFIRVSPGLFRTAGSRLAAGRDFTWTDIYSHRPMAMISENLARELWGSASAAVGRRLGTILPGSRLHEVIGVVENIRYHGVQSPAPAIVYWPSMGENLYGGGSHLDAIRSITIAVRSARAGSESLRNQIQQAVWSVNGALPVASVQTMQSVYGQSMARASFTLMMLAIASVMALVLGVIGIYGVISYGVSQRRREIGIRVALGAHPGELSRMFVRYGMGLAAVGLAIGLAASASLTQLLKSLLFGISPLDPVTYAVVPLVLAAAAALSSYLPARRAAAVDPVEALRE